MIKKLLLALLPALFLYGSDSSKTIQKDILAAIFKNISSERQFIIWSDDKELLTQFENDTEFTTSKKCEHSSLLILKDPQNINAKCRENTIFVLEYSLLKELPKSFGAFFWKKGRPNIVIIKPRLDALSISASQTLDRYIEEKIW